MALAEQGIVFSTNQEYAFERLFELADVAYVPDGKSYCYRGSELRFTLTCNASKIPDIPRDYQTPDTRLSGSFRTTPSLPAGALALELRAGGYRNTYHGERPMHKEAITNILGKIVKIEPEVLREPEEALEHIRLFNNYALEQVEEIQKTFDPYPGGDEKDAITLLLARRVVYSPKGRKVLSRVMFGRSVQWGDGCFAYWQTLQSDQRQRSIMLPGQFAYHFPSSFSAPSLGRNCSGLNTGGVIPMPQSVDHSLNSLVTFPRDLVTFEQCLQAIPENQMVGQLSTDDTVRLITEPLDESLRLRI